MATTNRASRYRLTRCQLYKRSTVSRSATTMQDGMSSIRTGTPFAYWIIEDGPISLCGSVEFVERVCLNWSEQARLAISTLQQIWAYLKPFT